MGLFSHSSRDHHYRNGNLGSGYYQRRGFLGNLVGMMGSGRHSHHQNLFYPPQNNYPPQNDAASNQPAMICGKCNSRIPAGSKFCLECGEMVKSGLRCSGCGQALPPNAKFCTSCGQKTTG